MSMSQKSAKRGLGRLWINVHMVLESPSKLFLLLAVVFGTFMIFLTPPLMVPDELAHFGRGYQVSEGHLLSETNESGTGGIVPTVPKNQAKSTREVPSLYSGNYFDRLTEANYKFETFPNSAVYSPISYIPQAMGIKIADVIYPSIGLMFILGRIFNLATFVVLILVAIRAAPRAKWVYVVAALLPMTIHQAASLSSDVMTIGLAFVIIAYIHKLFVSKVKLDRKTFIILGILSIGLALTKQTNIVLLFPLLFLPVRLFNNLSSKLLIVGSLLVTSMIFMVSWYVITKIFHYDLHFSPYDADIMKQLIFILHHVGDFFRVLFVTYIYGGISNGGTMLQDFFAGSVIGYFSWIEYKLPLASIISAYVLLFVTLFYVDGQKKDIYISRLAIIQLITFIGAMIATALILYLTWSAVGAGRVDGLQGRYFIALIPLLVGPALFLQKYLKISMSKTTLGVIVGGVSAVNLLVMILLTFEWFYQ
ncbi:MAG: DUF2142 domain-containing protein [Candidatus Microsaccharimonas sp.]